VLAAADALGPHHSDRTRLRPPLRDCIGEARQAQAGLPAAGLAARAAELVDGHGCSIALHSSMTWTLVTVPDERDRCCLVLDGARCERPSAIRIGDGSWDGYTFTCRAHVELVLASEPGCLSEPVSAVPDGRAGDETDVPRAPAELAAALIAEIRNALVPAQHHLVRLAADLTGEAGRVELVRRAVLRVLDYATRCSERLEKQ